LSSVEFYIEQTCDFPVIFPKMSVNVLHDIIQTGFACFLAQSLHKNTFLLRRLLLHFENHKPVSIKLGCVVRGILEALTTLAHFNVSTD
jgi:hypothetical protein